MEEIVVCQRVDEFLQPLESARQVEMVGRETTAHLFSSFCRIQAFSGLEFGTQMLILHRRTLFDGYCPHIRQVFNLYGQNRCPSLRATSLLLITKKSHLLPKVIICCHRWPFITKIYHLLPYLIFVIFFTPPYFLSCKKYTNKVRKFGIKKIFRDKKA